MITRYTPKTPVLVFGQHKGVVIHPGKMLPRDPANWVRVEYRDGETGTRYNSFVPVNEVTTIPPCATS